MNRNLNQNFSKVGTVTGTVKIVTVPQHWFTQQALLKFLDYRYRIGS
jgi:hypothetical protein